MSSNPSDESILATFRAAQERQLEAIRKINDIDALSAFILIVQWIDQAARYYRGSGNGEVCWRAFICEFFPAHYHPEWAIKLLYGGLRGKLSHELGTRGVLLTEDEPQNHWAEHKGLRVVHLPTLLADCEAAWSEFSDEIDADATLRAAVVARAPGIIQPVRLAVPGGAIAASASATSIDLEALGWPPFDDSE